MDARQLNCKDARQLNCKDARPCVSTKSKNDTNYNQLKRNPKSISSFVAGFKSVVTKQINQIKKTPRKPLWQSRFYDRIIRDDIELYHVREYIINNPENWINDELKNDA